MTIQTRTALLAGAALFSLTAIDAGAAESGFFMGGSIGTAAVEANVNDGIVLPDPPPIFDEDDFGWKFLAGYDFALSESFTLGIEGGYVDLGSPAADARCVAISSMLGLMSTPITSPSGTSGAVRRATAPVPVPTSRMRRSGRNAERSMRWSITGMNRKSTSCT